MDDAMEMNDRKFTQELDATIAAFEELSRVAEGEVCEPEEFFTAAPKNLTPEAFGHLLMQMVPEPTDNETRKRKQHLAIEVADVLGPDHAQALYRFAVLVTKLA